MTITQQKVSMKMFLFIFLVYHSLILAKEKSQHFVGKKKTLYSLSGNDSLLLAFHK